MMKRLFLTLCFLYVMSAVAWADDTLIIPLDFGGSISDEYIDSFIKAANELDGVRVMDYGERKTLLDTHFITVENAKSDDLGMIDLAESGAAAYNDGEHQNADEMFAEAFKIALAHPEFLAVTGDAAEEMWIAGAFWLQIQLYIKNDMKALTDAIDTMIRIFPLRTPSGKDFPDEIANIYRERMPNPIRGHKVTSVANLGCTLHFNGDVLSNDEEYYIYSGRYALAKVCGYEVIRVVSMEVYEPTVLSLESGLFLDFEYPSSEKYVEHSDTTREALSERLYTLAKILGVKQIVGIGYVPSGHPYLRSGFTAIVANTTRQGLVRARTARPEEVSTPSGMKTFASAVFNGELFQSEIAPDSFFSPTSWAGIGIGSAGLVSLIVGAVYGGLTVKENDKFRELELNDRQSEDYLDHAHKRDKYKLITDITLGVGAGLVVVGAGLILLDKFYLEPNSDNLYRADGMQFQFDIRPDGAQAGFSWTF